MFSRPWASLGVRTADTCESGWRRESINSAPAIHAAGPVAAFVGDIGVSPFVPVIVERYGYGDWNYGYGYDWYGATRGAVERLLSSASALCQRNLQWLGVFCPPASLPCHHGQFLLLICDFDLDGAV